MSILALDTATRAGSVALMDGGRTIISRYFDIGLQHSQRLFIEIEAVLETAGYVLQTLEAIAVSIGPGSFTGLRIGLSAAKGLCLGSGIDLVTVSTLDAVAARLPYARYPVCVILDARKKEVYSALYDMSAGNPQPLSAPRIICPADLLVERAGQETIFIGNGTSTYAEQITSCPWARIAPVLCSRPEAWTVGWLAQIKLESGELADLTTTEPDYLRIPKPQIGKFRIH